MKGETQALADSIFGAVKGYCDTAIEKLLRRAIEPLEQRIEAIPAPKDGRDGKDADPAEITKAVLVQVTAVLDAIPVPKDGSAGPQGEPGLPGVKGDAGPPGEKGEPGHRGEKGDAGEKGDSGEKGDRGEKGDTGERGAPGEPGPAGQKGEPGPNGEQGPQGKDGPPGLPGEPGRDGRDGQKGEPGRDALQIDILPAIDPARSYPRSTYAQFGGGIVRSTRTTDPIPDGGLLTDAGWSFIVRGISMLDMRQIDERNFEFSALFNDGTVEKKCFTIPAQIYRGVHSEGKPYERGDTVTWAGSLWHCETPTDERPGEGGAWRLAVKRGRDGKDGVLAEPRKPVTVKL